MTKVFLTATDTGAGKTEVALAWLRAHPSGRALKPLATGLDADGRNEDLARLAAAQRLPEAALNFRRWATPAAPAIAATRDGAPLDPAALLDWCRRRLAEAEDALIEGIGGLRVPLAWGFDVLDWIAALPECEVWLVAGARIGAINHALLSLDALERLGRPPARVIVNEPAPGLADAAAMLIEALRREAPGLALWRLGYGDRRLSAIRA